MTKVVIIGGGFGGLSVLQKLANSKPELDITLIDKKESFDFLPMLPDILGREIGPDSLSYKIEELKRKFRFEFIKDEVVSVDPDKRTIFTASNKSITYDYGIIASGSETNFYGQPWIQKNAYKLDDARDAARLHSILKKDTFENYVISGGGYTGVEVATNLRVFFNKNKLQRRIVICERAPSLLGPLPDEIKEYVIENLRKMDIEVLLNTTISSAADNRISFSSGLSLERSMLIWAAGVKTADFIQRLSFEKNPQGRLKVDEYLKIGERCFVIGDSANVFYEGKPLRMAVQFAILQGRTAAQNLIRSITNKPLKPYKPLDMGYIIPMANNRSCGIVLGVFIKGIFPTFLHYCMCIYRSYSIRNKLRIIKGLISK